MHNAEKNILYKKIYLYEKNAEIHLMSAQRKKILSSNLCIVSPKNLKFTTEFY